MEDFIPLFFSIKLERESTWMSDKITQQTGVEPILQNQVPNM